VFLCLLVECSPCFKHRQKRIHLSVEYQENFFSLFYLYKNYVSKLFNEPQNNVFQLTEHREIRNTYGLDSLCHCPLYEEAMHLAEEGKIYSRVLRY